MQHGAGIDPPNRFDRVHAEPDLADLEWDDEYLHGLTNRKIEYLRDDSKSIVAKNDSPDISFRYSVNPYRGCAHGCSYCFARPTHEYLGFSAGVDFETRVLYKPRAAELLREYLARPAWSADVIAFSGVTDCYQPIERKLRLTRGCLEVAAECRQPAAVITKNALVTRDVDLLQQLARHRAVRIALSITTLDQSLCRVMEPRTSAPAARLRALAELSAAGIETQVMIAPVIPGLNDSEIPAILAAARDAGAQRAGFLLLRLPSTVRPIFIDWLQQHRPNHAAKVESLIRATRGANLNESAFAARQRGQGEIADQIAQTFKVFSRKLGLDRELPPLNREAFRPPVPAGGQRRLF